jgi:hypothetical protein
VGHRNLTNDDLDLYEALSRAEVARRRSRRASVPSSMNPRSVDRGAERDDPWPGYRHEGEQHRRKYQEEPPGEGPLRADALVRRSRSGIRRIRPWSASP